MLEDAERKVEILVQEKGRKETDSSLFRPVRMSRNIRSHGLINAQVSRDLRPPSPNDHRRIWFRKSVQSENGSIVCWSIGDWSPVVRMRLA